MMRTRRALIPLAALVLLLPPAAGLASTEPVDTAPDLPDTPVGRQMSWLLEISTRLPVGTDEAAAHLSGSFLERVGLDAFNAGMAEAAGPDGFQLATFQPQFSVEDTTAGGSVVSDGRWHLNLLVDDAGLVNHLEIAPVPTSWAEVEQRLRTAAPQVSLLAAEVTRSGCEPVRELSADLAQPLGSLFKVYVLGALADAVRVGRAAWHERLAVRAPWQSLGPNPVDSAVPGTEFTLQEYANYMIAFSDNSATDHLIHHVGRDRVERQQDRFDLREPAANLPWLTTRELFQLRLTDYPDLAQAYLELDTTAERRDFLREEIAPLPLPRQGSWPEPRDVDTIEWFASPADLCRAHHGLRRQAATPGLEPVNEAMSRYENYLALDRDRWPVVWFKGGSEPGVMTLSYLAETADGRVYSVTLMATDPTAAIPPERFHELITIAHGAFQLTGR